MELYTCQLAQWRKIKAANLELLDITVKSGDATFAPAQDALYAYKRGDMDENEYTYLYKQKMRLSYVREPERWLSIVSRQQPLVLACYCPPGTFCHRLILVDLFKAVAIKHKLPLVYLGEWYVG